MASVELNSSDETEQPDDTTAVFLPEGWPRPKGYSNVVVLPRGRSLFIAGMVGWDESERMVGEDVASQFRQVLKNIVACAQAAGSRADCIGRMTMFVTDRQAYLEARPLLGKIYREVFGAHYPAMTLVEVKALLEEGALIEVEATGVVPD